MSTVTSVFSLEDWKKDWEKENPEFHENERNHLLVKHLKVLLSGQSNMKIFFPLCGKDVDMKWMYDLGHTVVGVELIEKGVRSFFSDQGLSPVVEDAPGVKGKLFKTSDARLRIYCCDIFSLNSEIEGQFDGIFDKGSFVIFNKETRPKYADLMISLMSTGCRYLLNTMQFEKGYRPSCMPDGFYDYTSEEITQLFTERNCFVEMVDLVALHEDLMFDKLQLITKKH